MHGARWRANKFDVRALAHLGEVRVLREKSVTGMNRIHVGDFGRAQDAINLQVTFRTRGSADANRWMGSPRVAIVALTSSRMGPLAGKPQRGFRAARLCYLHVQHDLPGTALTRGAPVATTKSSPMYGEGGPFLKI